jgi:hypothetical protein
MRRTRMLWLLALAPWPLLSPVGGPGRPQAPPVTTGSLYEEMIDLAGLTRFPSPAYHTVQFSSYDRRSNLPGGPDWFANDDGFGGEPIPAFEAVLRQPGPDSVGQYLMADVEGPGALVRVWTAAIEGTVQLWLDGQETPVYAGSADAFFHRPLDAYPQVASLDRARLVRTVYQRDAAYAPMPFARRFRLVWTGNLHHVHFYHLAVRRYVPGTIVATFRPEDLATYRETINRVIAGLADPDADLPLRGSGEPRSIAVTLRPGEAADALQLEGPGAIERLEFTAEAPDRDRALRQTVLHIVFDGYPWGQVQSPLGDFFGAAPGVNPYQSLPFTVRSDGAMISRFVMPYERSARIRLENLGDQTVTVTGSVRTMPYAWDAGRSMHFRARWRVNHDLIADPAAVQDIPFLLADGEGVYVGTTAIMLNPTPIPTPGGGWWGEGDEKVFVDGDRRPALFGTGSEDYFNYSWSAPDLFWLPYCGQPRNDGPGNRGFVTDYRFHIVDALPFDRSIAFYLELYSHERLPGFSYARIGYHYGRPGIIDDHLAITPADVRELRLPENWVPAARGGARNAVFHQTETLVRGARLLLETGRLYAGGRIPVWRPARPGEALHLRVPVDSAGQYRIRFVARLDGDGGRLRLQWDGTPVPLASGDSTVDLRLPDRTVLRDFYLRPMRLTAGAHDLAFVFDGAAAEVARPAIGIDFVWVQGVR